MISKNLYNFHLLPNPLFFFFSSSFLKTVVVVSLQCSVNCCWVAAFSSNRSNNVHFLSASNDFHFCITTSDYILFSLSRHFFLLIYTFPALSLIHATTISCTVCPQSEPLFAWIFLPLSASHGSFYLEPETPQNCHYSYTDLAKEEICLLKV